MMKIEFESKGLDELQNRYFDLYRMNQEIKSKYSKNRSWNYIIQDYYHRSNYKLFTESKQSQQMFLKKTRLKKKFMTAINFLKIRHMISDWFQS